MSNRDKPPPWKPFDPSLLAARIARVRELLVQAAAVGLAQDTERLAQIAKLGEATQKTTLTPRPQPPRRRRRS